MDTKKDNEELQSRREFFKKAAKGALPLFGIAVLGPSILSSCGDGNKNSSSTTSCKGCSGSCDGSCSGSCDMQCTGDCTSSCIGR